MKIFLFASLVACLLLAQSPDPGAHFEAADVHRSDAAPNPYTWASGNVVRGSRYDFNKATIIDLIRAAYGVDSDAIIGGPSWLEFSRYDIAAKTKTNTPPAAVRVMLQNLLAERFKLAIHKADRPMPALALTVGKTKTKLRTSDGSGDSGCTRQPQPAGYTFNLYACRNLTMDLLAQSLRRYSGDYVTLPVVNQTGLEGVFDFELKWNWRSEVLPAGSERITIFKALEQQLGLTLTPTKSPSPVMVIDRVNEIPTPNAPNVAQTIPPRSVAYEVADLKVNKGTEQSYINVTPSGGFEARNQSMKILLATAWDMDWDHVDEGFANLPKWIDAMRLDIHARSPNSTNGPPPAGIGFMDDDARLMLKNLLIDRFEMKTHVENRPKNAWTLTASKTRMRKADPTNRANCKDAKLVANDPRDANPRLSSLIACQNITMAQFAVALHSFASDYFPYEVEDATGLTGTYDFLLSYSPRFLLTAPGPEGSDPNGAVSLQDAIFRQLGLKLQERERLAPVVVIDSMRQTPLEN